MTTRRNLFTRLLAAGGIGTGLASYSAPQRCTFCADGDARFRVSHFGGMYHIVSDGRTGVAPDAQAMYFACPYTSDRPSVEAAAFRSSARDVPAWHPAAQA